jgi:hypothetical protein
MVIVAYQSRNKQTHYVDIRKVLGAFTKFYKNFVMSVRPCVRPSIRMSAWSNSASTGRIFMTLDIWGFFRKSVGKIKVKLKSDKNNRYVTWRPVYVFDNISLTSRMRNVLHKFVEKIKTYFLLSNFFFENNTVYKQMGNNRAGHRW